MDIRIDMQSSHRNREENQHVFVSMQLFASNKPLLPLSFKTAYSPYPAWNSWISIPFKYKSLPLDAQLCFTVWKLDDRDQPTPIYGTTFKMFGKNNTLRKGRHRLRLWPHSDADGSVDSSTLSKTRHGDRNEAHRIDKLLRKYERGDINHVDWLDSLLFQEIERIMKLDALETKDNYLVIELPQFDFPLVYSEIEYPLPKTTFTIDIIPNATANSTSFSSSASASSSTAASAAATSASLSTIASSSSAHPPIVVKDLELFRDNPIENKHRKLARSHRNGPLDRDLKPNAKIRDELNKILKYPPTQNLSAEAKDLLWKFRFYLTRDKKALTKFLKCVCWTDPVEVKQAVELLNTWVDVDVEDALELIGMGFDNKSVRRFGVSVLKRADDEEILLYLLQLVQTLKFEVLLKSKQDSSPSVEDISSSLTSNTQTASSAAAAAGIVASGAPSTSSNTSSNNNTTNNGSTTSNATNPNSSRISSSRKNSLSSSLNSSKNLGKSTEKSMLDDSPLTEFLLERAIKNPILGNNFYWYLMVECEDKNKSIGRMYARVAFQFMSAMVEVPDGFHRRDMLRRQGELVETLHRLSKGVRSIKEGVAKRVEYLQAAIADPKNGLLSFPPLPLPLDPSVHVTGMIPEKATVFKSNLSPLRLTFTCLDGSEYMLIFKVGDDLRQDQLVVQIITLMDKLLRKENLDLKLTPYKVLATGTTHGMVQFVPALPLASILSENSNSLMQYLRNANGMGPLSPVSISSTGSGTLYGPAAEDNQPMGVSSAIVDTYLKSCAGYCVITYLLGVGDRHLDNLLLTKAGNLFHVDFGFILGRDPKPFPPPMKLCKEMVEAMGGTSSAHHVRFKNYCFVAFNSLRKSANLILNLFALMVHANVPDIALEPDKAVGKVQEKFRLDLTEEEAIQYFQTIINESVNALFPQVMEKIHSFAQYWRK